MKRISIWSVQLVKESSSLYEVETKRVESPRLCFDLIQKVLKLEMSPVEKVGFLALNTKLEVIGVHVVGVGTVNTSLMEPKSIFQAALLNNATAIILFHNHPSGDPKPSEEDINITHRIVEAGRIIGIDVLDHIICGDDRFTSLSREGYIK
ncbi:MAG TPA: JAB domain-containing protein [Sporolactobacillaceae bacterium]|nr:JAB domain-containing protein [Sporolactobacillaceae bacterium]